MNEKFREWMQVNVIACIVKNIIDKEKGDKNDIKSVWFIVCWYNNQ